MIGIITFHRAVNYGAVLQTIALQHTLNALGIQNNVIDYRCEFIEKHYSPKPNVTIRHPKTFLKEVLQIPVRIKARKEFDSFLKENIKLSSIVFRDSLSEIVHNYDAIITGSDQVFNLDASGHDTTYLLDFVKNGVKKISYAASVTPNQFTEKNCKVLKKFLADFSGISIREKQSLGLLNSISGKDIYVHADPTALPEIDFWINLANKSKLKTKNFIFVYIMQPSDVLYDIAEKLAKEENLELKVICMVDNKRKIGKSIAGASIYDYLYMIKEAHYVITNSFHGVMMSLRFHKQFIWSYQKGSHVSNPRFEMLDELYGIEKRRCNSVDEINTLQKLDFKKIEFIRQQQKKIAQQYLLEEVGEYINE